MLKFHIVVINITLFGNRIFTDYLVKKRFFWWVKHKAIGEVSLGWR